MITGDHKDTTTAIGHMLGIVDEKFSEGVTGPELDTMSDEELCECVLTHNVFARASPQNKIRIVKALQAKGQVASMTGDGVNDAPALKAANMGVAMGKEGTDVAREASEMILVDDNFATIVYAVKQDRVVWDNLRKVLLVNTPINNSQGLSVLFGLLVSLPNTPITAIQIFYSNFICAVTLGFVTAFEPAEKGDHGHPPPPRREAPHRALPLPPHRDRDVPPDRVRRRVGVHRQCVRSVQRLHPEGAGADDARHGLQRARLRGHVRHAERTVHVQQSTNCMGQRTCRG